MQQRRCYSTLLRQGCCCRCAWLPVLLLEGVGEAALLTLLAILCFVQTSEQLQVLAMQLHALIPIPIAQAHHPLPGVPSAAVAATTHTVTAAVVTAANGHRADCQHICPGVATHLIVADRHAVVHNVADGDECRVPVCNDLLLLLLQLCNGSLHGLGLFLQLSGILLGLQDGRHQGRQPQ